MTNDPTRKWSFDWNTEVLNIIFALPARTLCISLVQPWIVHNLLISRGWEQEVYVWKMQQFISTLQFQSCCSLQHDVFTDVKYRSLTPNCCSCRKFFWVPSFCPTPHQFHDDPIRTFEGGPKDWIFCFWHLFTRLQIQRTNSDI